VADPTICKHCYVSRGLEAGLMTERAYELAKKTELVQALKNAR
jgi:hypothetical protein